MNQNKFKVSKDATHRLKMLKGRTQLTPNILCRIAFCHSLEDPRPVMDVEYDNEGQEYNRFTLLGEWDPLFMALLRERCLQDGLPLDDETLYQAFRAHVNRGVMSIFNKVKTLDNLQDLLTQRLVAGDGRNPSLS